MGGLGGKRTARSVDRRLIQPGQRGVETSRRGRGLPAAKRMLIGAQLIASLPTWRLASRIATGFVVDPTAVRHQLGSLDAVDRYGVGEALQDARTEGLEGEGGIGAVSDRL